ncbi:hypothetical protein Sste5346_009156 [Sporothrix stenoceras]|uniref:Zn(2)-C6 fungal-type domain-containing protein n=1 Tax=Sporothrix stenoceras TaxID=5173 RepID=A0ABR3YMQ2_9PEZI
MDMFYEPKACRACAKSKRKCGREQPACVRCQTRGVVCEYPPTRPGTFAAVLDDVSSISPIHDAHTANHALTPPVSVASTTSSPGNSSSNLGLGSFPSAGIAPCGPQILAPPPGGIPLGGPVPPISSRQCIAWFLNAESWKVDHQEASLSTSFCSSFLKIYVTHLQDWLAQWTATGSNPFIHAHLYAARFPDNLQIAFTTLTTYRNRTKHNAEIVLKIVEDQASKLVGSSSDGILSSNATASHELSLLDQCARLHALIVYQTISLFDGDIRARHLAESRLPLLGRWAQQLLESAREKFSSTPHVLDMTTALYFGPMDSQEHPWYLWILTESIRRTWLTAGGLEAIYSMLQRGWHPCPGGVMFTTRKGIWDASSALAWETNCSVGAPEGVGFIHRFETDKLFATRKPDEVDDFTRLMMEITYGVERMEKWLQEAATASTTTTTRTTTTAADGDSLMAAAG